MTDHESKSVTVGHPRQAKIFVVSNTAWSLYHFRLPLMKGLRDAGYDVAGVSPPDEYSNRVLEAGFHCFEVDMEARGTNPAKDLLLAIRLYRLFRTERPDLLLTYTAKPNIYGSLAARALGIPVVNTIPGLGHLFTSPGLITRIGMGLYRLALRGSRGVLFQNRDDLEFFLGEGLVRPSIAERVPGSGVDTARFSPRRRPDDGHPFVFLLVARLLKDKGIGEFVEAARLVKSHRSDVQFRILGALDPGHPRAISATQVHEWESDGIITYLGRTDDVVAPMRAADCVVLPSYYGEGIPRALLEGASLGKPLIAADSRGSRDIVEHGVNGLLCEPGDPEDLAASFETMLNLDPECREGMGNAGRERACREFDERIVIERYLEAISAALME